MAEPRGILHEDRCSGIPFEAQDVRRLVQLPEASQWTRDVRNDSCREDWVLSRVKDAPDCEGI